MKHKGQAIYNQLIGKFKTRQKIGRVLLKQSSYDSPVHKSTHNSVTRREKGAKDHKSVECTPRRSQDTDGGLVNNREYVGFNTAYIVSNIQLQREHRFIKCGYSNSCKEFWNLKKKFVYRHRIFYSLNIKLQFFK